MSASQATPHRVSYVPIPLVRFMALTLPWRSLSYVSIPEAAIREAERRNELPDQLFVLWATERNARAA